MLVTIPLCIIMLYIFIGIIFKASKMIQAAI